MTDIPDGLRLTLDTDPPPTFRSDLGQLIDAFHSETVPCQSTRFGLKLLDATDTLVGGVSAVMSWNWLFIAALWVHANQRGKGAGRALLTQAETHAVANGCHSVWLDTFQAKGFYETLGYTAFGALEDYPEGQTRSFMRKRLPQR